MSHLRWSRIAGRVPKLRGRRLLPRHLAVSQACKASTGRLTELCAILNHQLYLTSHEIRTHRKVWEVPTGSPGVNQPRLAWPIKGFFRGSRAFHSGLSRRRTRFTCRRSGRLLPLRTGLGWGETSDLFRPVMHVSRGRFLGKCRRRDGRPWGRGRGGGVVPHQTEGREQVGRPRERSGQYGRVWSEHC